MNMDRPHLPSFSQNLQAEPWELSGTEMPVLSEDSGECLSWGLPEAPETRPCPAAPGRDCWRALGDRAWGDSVHTAGSPWGPTEQEVPRAWAILRALTLSSGLHETLALLTSQLRPDSNHKEEMGFLRDVFSEKSLSYLMKVKPHFIPSAEGF